MSLEDVAGETDDAGGGEGESVSELRARIDLLEEENRRLREEYVRARRSQYRRTAAALVAVGLLALGAAALFPVARTVLIALGGVGVFAGLLTYYLTPERFVPARVGERVYGAYADSAAAIVADLGLADERVYVPTGDDSAGRLFVPQQEGYTIPETDALRQAFVVTDDPTSRGATFTPTGGSLFEEFEQALSGSLAATPAQAAQQLADGLVEQFELVDSAQVDDTEPGRVTVAVDGSAYGGLDRFDHPVVSLLAVGLARAVDGPVGASVTEGDDRFDALVTLRWETDEEPKS